jgi:tetratricopeptide (TPR) repeat protein
MNTNENRIEQLKKMLETEPFDSFLNYALALEYEKSNKIHHAIELLETLLLRDQNYLGAYYQLGKYYELVQKRESSIDIYKKGIAIALEQKNRKTLSELREALILLEEEDE